MKKILFVLLCLIGFSSFCSAGVVQYDFTLPAGTYNHGKTIFYLPYPLKNVNVSKHEFDFSCEFGSFDGNYGNSVYYMFQINGIQFNNYDYNKIANWSLKIFNSTSSLSTIFNSNGGLFTGHVNITRDISQYMLGSFNFYNDMSSNLVLNSPLSISCIFSGDNILSSSCPVCSPQYTSEECQIEYDLVSSSDLFTCNNNLQSCQASLSGRNNTLNNCSNNLLSCESSLSSCIQSNCPIDTGSVMWSSIWINGIQHLGKPVINIDIPSNIYWDYVTNDEQFDLYIGSGYDQEYIDGVISVNSYRPSSEDFTSIFVGGLTLVFPYIIIALFVIFIRKLIKRIFK